MKALLLLAALLAVAGVVVAVAVAFEHVDAPQGAPDHVASSHHWVHMLLISLGLGFGFTAALFDPTVRRAMLVVSLAMTALVAWWMLRHPSRGIATVAGLAASIAISLGLVAYTVIMHGW